METIIRGKKIVKSFGKAEERTKVLDCVDVELFKGEFAAVMGPSGSGKSTLLFSLSGADHITSGSVTFNGMELAGLSEKKLADIRRTKMGFVFQQPTMLKNLNLLDNIILSAVQEDRKNTVGITQKARELMEKTGISQLEQRDITAVSGGQLQRAGICRALMSTPEILFADEPTGALNSKASEEIMDLFSEINQEGTAILLVTHDAKVAARAERVLFMKDGKMVSELCLGKWSAREMDIRMSKVVSQMKQMDL